MSITALSAITLATHGMADSVRFYSAAGFKLSYGGEGAEFSSFAVGQSYLNIVTANSGTRWSWWGRVIFHVDDVDEQYRRLVAAGYRPQTEPADASWGERYFHILDPDGHEISFAKRLRG